MSHLIEIGGEDFFSRKRMTETFLFLGGGEAKKIYFERKSDQFFYLGDYIIRINFHSAKFFAHFMCAKL